MTGDTISYINILRDSTELQDTVPKYMLTFDPVEGEITNIAKEQLSLKYFAQQDNISGVSRYYGEPLPFSLEQIDGVFCLLLLCVFFFAHIYNGGIAFLKENISFLIAPLKASRLHSQTTSREMIYSYFLVFQSVVLSAICIYDAFIEYEPFDQSNNRALLAIVSFIIFIALFVILKDFLYRTIGYIFDQQKTMRFWRRTYMVSIEILGILYFIPTLLLIYSSYYHFQILVFILILFFIVQITLFYQIIVFFINQKFNFLYLIAYLCTFEILPYIYLSGGLIYLYKTDVFNTLL